MRTPATIATVLLCGLSVAAGSAMAQAPRTQTPQASTERSTITTPEAEGWMPLPDLFPEGAQMQVLHGNPATGASELYFKVPANYTFPWHFHTPVEKLFMHRGQLNVEMRDGHKDTMEPGDFMYVPARSPHLVTCLGNTECFFFLSSDGPFDVHLVDENWRTTRSWRASDQAAPAGTSGSSR